VTEFDRGVKTQLEVIYDVVGLWTRDDTLYAAIRSEDGGFKTGCSIGGCAGPYSDRTDFLLVGPEGDVWRDVPVWAQTDQSDLPTVVPERVGEVPPGLPSIESNIPKQTFITLIEARLAGVLTPDTVPLSGSDYATIIEAYPEMEPLLDQLTNPAQLWYYADRLPHSVSPEEMSILPDLEQPPIEQ